jgi:hypothetical protein
MEDDNSKIVTLSEHADNLQNDERTCRPAGTDLTQRRSPRVLGFTYFVRRSQAIKIGHADSDDPAALQMEYPGPLHLLAIVPAHVVTSKTAREKFVHLRAHGWFRAEPELLEFIEAAAGAAIFPQLPKTAPKVPSPLLHPAVAKLKDLGRQLSSRHSKLPAQAKRIASNIIAQTKGIMTLEDVERLKPQIAHQTKLLAQAMG